MSERAIEVEMDQARAHYENWPPPDGRTMLELLKGKMRPGLRWLWPQCQGYLAGAILGKMSDFRVTRFLWGMYNVREGTKHPYRWQFWTAPPNLGGWSSYVWEASSSEETS